MKENNSTNISIIICTYKPDRNILQRCLQSVSALKRGSLEVECFLVDNNSPAPIADLPEVKLFLQHCPWASLIVEKKQGLTHARLAGFKKSSAPLIVFFDDDNEPDADYLLGLVDYAKRLPQVGAFGPGIVSVEYTDPVMSWLENYKGYFQQYSTDKEEHSSNTEGYQSHFPFGTGMVVKREVLEEYQRYFATNKIAGLDRTGNSLSSSGDIQIVWIGVKMGYEAGKTPLLKINHLINAKKANKSYLRRLVFSTAESYLAARLEIFPEEKENARNTVLTCTQANIRLAKIFLRNSYKKDLSLLLAQQAGVLSSYYKFFDKRLPISVHIIKKWFKV